MNEIEMFEKFIGVVEKAIVEHKKEQEKVGGTMEFVGSFCEDIRHYENYHSNLLSYLLNPKSDHRHGSEYLKLFLKQIASENSNKNLTDIISQVDENVQVWREYTIDNNRRIDILIEKTDEFAIIIENKVDAKDQEEQIIDYYSCMKNRYQDKPVFVVYLTKYGKEADKNSTHHTPKEIIFNMSYKEHILAWLRQLPTKQNEHLIRSALDQYIYTVQKLTGQTPEEINLMSNLKKELLDVIKKDNIGLEEISGLEKVMLDLVLEQTFNEIKLKLNEKLKDTPHDEIKCDPDNRSWPGIHLPMPILDDKAKIRLEIKRNKNSIISCYYGIKYEKREEALPILNNIIKGNDPNWHYLKFIDIDNIDSIVDGMANLYQECYKYMKNKNLV